MKKKILSVAMAMVMVLSLLPSAFAVDSTAIAEYEDLEGNVTSFNSLEKMKEYFSDFTIPGGVLTLQNDIVLESTNSSAGAVGIIIAGGVLDLNGHTITFTVAGNDPVVSFSGILATNLLNDPDFQIKNGTLLIDVDATDESPVVAITHMSTTDDPAIKLENLSILSTGNKSMTYGLFDSSNKVSNKVNAVMTNCVIDPGNNGSAIKVGATSDIQDGQYPRNVKLVSGSYRNLSNNENDNIEIPASSSKMSSLPVGVDTDTTVITSDATTAIIVDDGNAYLYDNLQEAVDAVEKGETIHLLKQPPKSESIELPTDASVTVAAFGDESIKVSEIPFTTKEGYKVVVDKEGNVSVKKAEIPVESITLDTDKLTLYTNTTPNTATITATLTPSDATDTVKWSSNNTDVVVSRAQAVTFLYREAH